MAKFRNINHTAFERAHFLRIERYARAVEQVYAEAIKEFAQLAGTVNFDPNRPFTFSSYRNTHKVANRLFAEMANMVTATVLRGDKEEWLAAASNNDRLVEAISSTSRVQRHLMERYSDRNLDALKAFQNRKIGGMGLSDRIWLQTQQFKDEIEMGIDLGLGEGRSAAQLSRDLRSYLKEPDKLFRRVRDKHGALHLSRAAKSFNPGQGVYRSSYKNAMRLTRTETNMAYRESDYHRWQEMDFIVGFEVRLSNNPNHCPMCAQLAGRYPKEFKFTGWHPQCRCRAIPIFKTDEEVDGDIARILEGDNALQSDESANVVTAMPDGYMRWMQDNGDRIRGAKSTPYFIRDNYKGGDVGKGLRFSVSEPPTETSKTIDIGQFITKDAPTNAEIRNILTHYAEQYTDDFRNGLETVKFVKSRSYMMQHSMRYKPSDNSWVGKSTLTISTNTFESIKFNPADELRCALAAIKKGKELTFNQEYSIESLWHEILHAKTKTPPQKLTRAQTKTMETVNQFVARHTYDGFLESLGGKATHKSSILEKGYGYSSWVSEFRKRLKDAGITEAKALEALTPALYSDYRGIGAAVRKLFSDIET